MGRISRRKRVTCKLACEIVQSGRRRVKGRIVTLSEGGLAVVTALDFEQGDSIRILIRGAGGDKSLPVSAIVWNDRKSANRGVNVSGPSSLRRYGCVVSEPSRSFLALLERLDLQTSRATANVVVPIAKPQKQDTTEEFAGQDLPRSRELQPPPKSEPEESWPYFRVRMKQVGGPRTRILTLRARSATQAERLAQEKLSEIAADADGWGILHIARVSGGRKST